MARREYPNTHVTFTTLRKRGLRGEHWCHRCGQVIPPTYALAVIETQVSWFRGEDDVELMHAECWAACKRNPGLREIYGPITGDRELDVVQKIKEAVG